MMRVAAIRPIVWPLVLLIGFLLCGPVIAQDKPLFVAKKDTQISWNELRDKYGWNGRPTMPMLEARGRTTGGWNEKTGLFMTKGRFALDNLEIDGEIGQGPKGVLFKQGTKILSRR
jgi:hypothetical protein